LGEVEEYDRVVIDHLDAATVDGGGAADLTHLVAELIENALHFSTTERKVEIIGRRRPTGGYMLAIVDHGVGMSAEELARSNQRLAGADSFTVAPSRYLGHYVVGNHAARLGVTVRLTDSPTGGVTAQIDVDAVLTKDGSHSEETASQVSIVPERFDVDRRSDEPAIVEMPAPDELPGSLARPARAAESGGPARAAESGGPARAAEGPEPVVAEPSVTAAVAVTTSATLPTADAAEGAPAPAGRDEPRTASGYKRRVRGANTPRTDVTSAGRSERTGGDEDPAANDTSTADGVRNLLSGLQAGTERGRAEADHNLEEDADERA
jgi:hypothetical protein